MRVTDEWPQFHNHVRYSNDSNLNTLHACIPRPTSANDKTRLWIVYIHGGAWFDPDQTASTFNDAQDILLKSSIADNVAGLASINYRLSPAPSHPTNPSNPDDPARNAKHPDHINDVLAALLHLQETYRFEDRYILVGHSCGAFLALQVAMKRYWGQQYESTQALTLNVVPPLALCCIEGLYDLPALVHYQDRPFYRNFVEQAFGSNEEDWKTASPTNSDYNETWQDGKLVVIAHSHQDELVEWQQPELVMKSLQRQGFTDSGNRKLRFLELQGKHDLWQGGVEVARAIEFTFKEVVSMA